MLKTVKAIVTFLCICLCGKVRADFSWDSGFFDSVADIASGVKEWLPSPESVLDTSMQLLVGLPETSVMKSFDQLCNAYMPLGQLLFSSKPNVGDMFLQFRTPCYSISYRLNETKKLLKNSQFDKNKSVVVFITGWTTDIGNPAIEHMAKAFHCRGGYNFLALNASDLLQSMYDWSALNTEDIGDFLAESLIRLIPTVPVKNIYLIGHSLGAQIAGKAGRHFKELTNQTLSRITGLDPASVCFKQGNEVLSGIFRGDADFVDIIHTNPGGAGKDESLGNVDFYPGGLGAVKPGCTNFGCSHSRAISYYEETVYPENEQNFLGQRCNSLGYYCDGPFYPMGYGTPTSIRGDYFLEVNPLPPFGKNATSNAVTKPKNCIPCPKGFIHRIRPRTTPAPGWFDWVPSYFKFK